MPSLTSVLARTEIDPEAAVRQTVEFTVHIPKIGSRKRTIASGIVPEDDLVNKMKAYLYCIALGKLWDRKDTPFRVRMDLTRSGIVP